LRFIDMEQVRASTAAAAAGGGSSNSSSGFVDSALWDRECGQVTLPWKCTSVVSHHRLHDRFICATDDGLVVPLGVPDYW
jgi:hypothetical protein